MNRKNKLLTEKYQKFLAAATMLFAFSVLSGCAHQPLLQEWDWSIRPDQQAAMKRIAERDQRLMRELEESYKKYPSLRNAVDAEEMQVEMYDENGKKKGTARILY